MVGRGGSIWASGLAKELWEVPPVVAAPRPVEADAAQGPAEPDAVSRKRAAKQRKKVTAVL